MAIPDEVLTAHATHMISYLTQQAIFQGGLQMRDSTSAARNGENIFGLLFGELGKTVIEVDPVEASSIEQVKNVASTLANLGASAKAQWNWPPVGDSARDNGGK